MTTALRRAPCIRALFAQTPLRLTCSEVPRVSLTWRVVLGFALLSLCLSSASGVYLFHALKREMAQRDREELAGKVLLFQKALSEVANLKELRAEPEALTHFLIGHDSLALRIRDGQGSTQLATHAPLPGVHLNSAIAGKLALSETGLDGVPWSGLAAAGQLADGGAVVLEVWRNVEAQHALLAWYRQQIVIAATLATLLAGLLGWLLVRMSLQPLQELTDATRAIHSDTLHQHLNAEKVPAELQGLVASFNELLARLDASFSQLSNYASDLAHEMRTPLGILLGQTQVALSRERSPDEYRQVLADNAEELERLAKMVNDLLFLAKAGQAEDLLTLGPIELGEETQRVCDFFEGLAEEKHIALRVSGQLRCQADQAALRRLLNNLVSNAIRYSPPGETVYLTIDSMLPGISIDNTPTEALPADLDTLFSRFYSPNRQSDGHGLGLTIARAIARLHGGDISAELSGGRLFMRVRLGRPESPLAPL